MPTLSIRPQDCASPNLKRHAPSGGEPSNKRLRLKADPIKRLKTQLTKTRGLVHESTVHSAQNSLARFASLWTSLQPEFDKLCIPFKQNEDFFATGLALFHELNSKALNTCEELRVFLDHFFNKMLESSKEEGANSKSQIVHYYFLIPFKKDDFKNDVMDLAASLNNDNKLSPFPSRSIDSLRLQSEDDIITFIQSYSATFSQMAYQQKLMNQITFSLFNIFGYDPSSDSPDLNENLVLRSFRSFKNNHSIQLFLMNYFNEFYYSLLTEIQLPLKTKQTLIDSLLSISGPNYTTCITALLHTRHTDPSISLAILDSQKGNIFSEDLFNGPQLLTALLKIKHKSIREWVILKMQRCSTPLPLEPSELQKVQVQLEKLEAYIKQCLGSKRNHPADLMTRMLTGHYDAGVRQDTWGFKTDSTNEKTAQTKAIELITTMFTEFKVTPKLTPILVEGGAGLGLFMTTFFEQLETYNGSTNSKDQELFESFKNQLIYVIIEQSKELSDRWKTVSAIQNNQYLSDEQKKILTSKFDNHQIKIFNKSFLDKEFINQLSKTFPTTKNLIYHYSNEIVDVLAHHYVSKDANGNLQIFQWRGL